MKEFLNNLVKSLNPSGDGFSFRKLLCLVIVCLVVYSHIEYITSANVLTAILYDFGFICVLLGLFNIDRFVAAKWGGDKSLPGEEPKAEGIKVEEPKAEEPKDPADEEVAK